MAIKNMAELRAKLNKVGNVDMLSTGNEKDRIKFFKNLSKVMLSASTIKYSDKALLELSMILRSKGIVRMHTYYKANKIKPSSTIFEIVDAKSSEFPALLYSTIAYGTDAEIKTCMKAFKGKDNMMSKWVLANKGLESLFSM